MKILSADLVKKLEQHSCEIQGISMLQLMERAGIALFEAICSDFPESEIAILAGKGNNGGDAFVLHRLFQDAEKPCSIAVINYTDAFSKDAETNYNLISDEVKEITSAKDLEQWLNDRPNAIVLDGLLGNGVNRPLKGLLKDVVKTLNSLHRFVISIDLPTGLYPEEIPQDLISVKANLVYTFHAPKLSLLMPEVQQTVQDFKLLDIGLEPNQELEKESVNSFFTHEEADALIRHRGKFESKKCFGWAYLVAGSEEYPGAGILSAKACLRTGVGRLSIEYPAAFVNTIMQSCPEAILSSTQLNDLTATAHSLEKYTAFGFGPGLGLKQDLEKKKAYLKWMLQHIEAPMVLDADALNILSEEKTWLHFLPVGTVLTPHADEFQRLLGKRVGEGRERLKEAKLWAQKYKVVLVLKGAHTAVIRPDGFVSFNSSGNVSLAKGGTGDVLTGMILSYLAQGYDAFVASCLAVYYHGLAADSWHAENSGASMLASDLIEELPKVLT